VEAHHLHLLSIISKWANSNVCRQLQIDSYFQREELYHDWPGSSESTKCQKCDNCLLASAVSPLPSTHAHWKVKTTSIASDANDDQEADMDNYVEKQKSMIEVSQEATLLTSLVKSLNYNYGWTNLVGILTGSKAKSFNVKLMKNKYYDSGSYHTQAWWRAFGELMIDLQYLKYIKLGGLYSKRKSTPGKNGVIQLVGPGKHTNLKKDQNGELWLRPNAQLLKLSKIKETASLGYKSTELLNELKQFRQEQSQKHSLPPYLLLPDPVMMEIVKIQPPLTMPKLMQVDGMTSQSIQKIGHDLIEIVNKILLSASSSTGASSSTKSVSRSSLNANQQKSYELLKDFTGGDWKKLVHDDDSIKIKPETVENHIVKLIGMKLLPKEPYISDDHYEKITEYLGTTEAQNLSLLREKRQGIIDNNDFEPSYLELKICMELA
jgi:hypothetical protein